MDWEWATRVTVTREGMLTRSGVEEVDEAEIFEGAENRLTMNQTYTWDLYMGCPSCNQNQQNICGLPPFLQQQINQAMDKKSKQDAVTFVAKFD